jgi:hypothetical protein
VPSPGGPLCHGTVKIHSNQWSLFTIVLRLQNALSVVTIKYNSKGSLKQTCRIKLAILFSSGLWLYIQTSVWSGSKLHQVLYILHAYGACTCCLMLHACFTPGFTIILYCNNILTPFYNRGTILKKLHRLLWILKLILLNTPPGELIQGPYFI